MGGVSCNAACKCYGCENDGSLLSMTDLGLTDWVMPGAIEPTGPAVGVESVLIIPGTPAAEEEKKRATKHSLVREQRNRKCTSVRSGWLHGAEQAGQEVSSPPRNRRRVSDSNRLSDEWNPVSKQEVELTAENMEAALEADLVMILRDSNRDSNRDSLRDRLQLLDDVELTDDLMRMSLSPQTIKAQIDATAEDRNEGAISQVDTTAQQSRLTWTVIQRLID